MKSESTKSIRRRFYAALGVSKEEWSPYAKHLVEWADVDWPQVEALVGEAPEEVASVAEKGPTEALLGHAVEANAAEMVQLLLQRGVEIHGAEEKVSGSGGEELVGGGLLHRVAAANATQAAVLLLDAAAAPNARDDRDQTPLHWAAEAGARKVSALLLGAGADPNARDDFDETPLHGAAREDAASVAKVLLEAGADPNARNRFDDTPLDQVVSAYSRTARLIKKAGGRESS